MSDLQRIIKLGIIFILFMIFLFQIEFNPVMMRFQNGRLSHIIIAIVYLVKNFPICKRMISQSNVSKMIYYSFIIYGYSIVWALIIILFREGDLTYFKDYIVALWGYVFVYIALALMIHNNIKCGDVLTTFIKMYLSAQCVYVSSSIMFIVFPLLRNWWMNIFFQTDRFLHLTESVNYVTRIGLHGYSGFADTIQCSIGVLFSLYLFSKTKAKIYWLLMFFMLLGNFFYGRSGMIFSLFIILFYSLKQVHVKRFIMLLISLFTCLVFFNIIVSIASSDTILVKGLHWALRPYEAFYSAWQYGEFSLGRSGDVMLQRMYFIPSDVATILFGDGRYTTAMGHYYMATDVGFMRHMLFFGVVGEFLLYLSFGLLLLNMRCLFRRLGDTDGVEFSFLFFLLTFFFEAKGTPIFGLWGLVLVLNLCITMNNERARITSLKKESGVLAY